LAAVVTVLVGLTTPTQAAPHHDATHSPRSAPARPGAEVMRPDLRQPPTPHHAPPGPIEDEAGESAASGNSTDYVLYRGGWIQESPTIYLILWGDWSLARDTYNVQNQLYYFYEGIGGSPYANVLTGYGYNCTVGTMSCPNGVMFKNPTGQFMNWWKDTTTVPATPTDSQVQAEIARAAAHFGDYSHNAQYVLALPPGHGDVGFKAGTYCAYHYWTPTARGSVPYTLLPYLPDAGTGCFNNTFGSRLDGVTIVASHEYAESVTDPYVQNGDRYAAWTDSTSNAGEVGDKCAGSGTTYNAKVNFNTGVFPVQSVWSNYARYYTGWGCVFHN
jgi:hypothetical protein